MDFRFTAEEEALRVEATEFVRQEWEHNDKDAYSMIVASYDVDDVDEEERMHVYAKKLAEKGWFTMHWPKEFGGWGAPLSTQLAYREAMAYAGSPEILGGGMFAPMLMMHGADWQRDFFLPRIASGEIHHLSQGFSEPNAGSDLANVQTRATEDGDDFVLNGQKIWNSEGRWADWGHYLVRTDPTAPKHRGISYFIIDMNDPGITLRPLYDGLGRWRWSEVFLEDVRIPKRNLIGELNRGFYTAMTTLSFERSTGGDTGPPAALHGAIHRGVPGPSVSRRQFTVGQPRRAAQAGRSTGAGGNDTDALLSSRVATDAGTGSGQRSLHGQGHRR